MLGSTVATHQANTTSLTGPPHRRPTALAAGSPPPLTLTGH
ncbi:hypothetical protein [Levilactobacillus sp. FUA 3915]